MLIALWEKWLIPDIPLKEAESEMGPVDDVESGGTLVEPVVLANNCPEMSSRTGTSWASNCSTASRALLGCRADTENCAG
jgi:hypothetical protein